MSKLFIVELMFESVLNSGTFLNLATLLITGAKALTSNLSIDLLWYTGNAVEVVTSEIHLFRTNPISASLLYREKLIKGPGSKPTWNLSRYKLVCLKRENQRRCRMESNQRSKQCMVSGNPEHHRRSSQQYTKC